MSLINELKIPTTTYLIYPAYLSDKNKWDDFGNATSENMASAFVDRILLSDFGDIHFKPIFDKVSKRINNG